MTRLERRCRALRAAGGKALVPYLTAGFPDEETSLALLAGAAARGCAAVEVGVPFSDPVADGPVIQQASQRALERGMTLVRALDLVRELAGGGAAPVVMTYLNPILRLGTGAFADAAARAGCAGVIVPDLSFEESPELRAALAGADLPLIDLVAPTTDSRRLARIAPAAAGFLYLVAVTGVTGTRAPDARDLAALTARAREHTDLPLYVGFGIDGPVRAREAAAAADGAIVGSALVRCFLDHPDPRSGLTAALALVDELLAALPEPQRRSAP
jgi:tryptophan synthase alpha chain